MGEINPQSRHTIYLAGPLGFSEVGRHFVGSVLIPTLSDHGFEIVDPFRLTDQRLIDAITQLPSADDRRERWRDLNKVIAATNQAAIDRCDGVLAILDGTDVDSGTAAEIGYAFARGKRILGYRGDFRLSADNEGAIINLQVEHFIRASGGDIVTRSALIGNELRKLIGLR